MLRDVTYFPHPEVGVSKSVWRFELDIGVLYLSHAMLVLVELIVCSTGGGGGGGVRSHAS